MLLTLKPTIDLTLLSNNALMLGQQLIDLSKDCLLYTSDAADE